MVRTFVFCAGVHPSGAMVTVSRFTFSLAWVATVSLLRTCRCHRLPLLLKRRESQATSVRERLLHQGALLVGGGGGVQRISVQPTQKCWRLFSWLLSSPPLCLLVFSFFFFFFFCGWGGGGGGANHLFPLIIYFVH